MMRRRMPWVLVALLFLAWSYGIFNERFGADADLASPDAVEASLTYLDRTLRIDDYAATQHGLLAWSIHPSPDDTLLDARDGLASLETNENFDQEARDALALMREETETPQEDLSKLDPLTRETIEGDPVDPAEIEKLEQKLKSGRGTWWDAETAKLLLETQPDETLSKAVESQQQFDRKLFYRASITGVANLALSIIGLIFIPHLIGVIRRGWTIASLHRPVRYSSRWEPSLVIAILLAGDLAAGYFIKGAYLATSWIDTGFTFSVLLDTAWRVFAPGIALVILFRKPSHAIRSLGLNTLPSWRVILAVYALLSWFNYGFGLLAGQWMPFDPSGGLDLMEKGWGGLFYGLLSACVLAPICEEVFYRGLLLRGLERRFGFWFSAAVVSVAFALGHPYDLFGMISVGTLGFVMVVVYRVTGSLTTIIVFHALYNFTITLPQWLTYHASL